MSFLPPIIYSIWIRNTEKYNREKLRSIFLCFIWGEEFTKPLAIRLKLIKKEISEPEDGLIYGAVAGLGFSATENLVYGWSFMKEGLFIFFILISVRSIGACLLHASATAWTGYGYGKTLIKGTSIIRVLPYFLFAIFLHSAYNSLLVFDIFGLSIGFIAAILLSLITIKIVRTKIRSLEKNAL